MPSGSIPHDQQRPDSGKRHQKRQEIPQPEIEDSYELTLARKLLPALIAVPVAALLDRDLDDEALFVFTGICAYTNMDGELWISHRTLATIIHRSVEQVEAAIERLKARGYLDTEVSDHE